VPLPADARDVHVAAIVFLSDFYAHWPFEWRYGPRFDHARFRPLDHHVWVHRPVRWDDWWLLETKSEVAHDGRALALRTLADRSGRLVASAATEALIATLPA
jgi:acyl-CoA thioesterase-2